MARQPRIEYAGAVYRVMARGNQGRPIFADDQDRQAWLNTLGQACENTGAGRAGRQTGSHKQCVLAGAGNGSQSVALVRSLGPL